MLRQLATHWEEEFDHLCALLVHASVVYMDATGWKIGKEGCSLWAFATELQRVFVFGCRKDAETLDAMLPPDLFDGVGVSDDAAVYRERFAQGQKSTSISTMPRPQTMRLVKKSQAQSVCRWRLMKSCHEPLQDRSRA